jgi:GH24 family phage-related lysozyme (muramidase)
MYDSVRATWLKFNDALEGHLPYLYLDILGYVTTGMGNLVDPLPMALSLPWLNADGSQADQATITTAWHAVDACRSDPKGKRQTSGLATKYGQAFAGVTTIRLSEDGIQQLIDRQVTANELELRKHFTAYDTMPADGQMAINSMAWAMGAGFPATFKTFTAAVNAGDWATALANANFRGAGVATRIAANKVMLANAGQVAAQGLDASDLHYPAVLAPVDAA